MTGDSKPVLRALREVTTLRSQRLSFERFSAEYVSAEYVGWMNHPEIRRWLVSCQGKETTKADLEKYVDGLGPDVLQLAIVCEGRHIGNIKIYDLDPTHRRMEVGYLIGEREEWGKGFAAEAVGRVVSLCFDELDLHKVTSGCLAGNEASARVLSKSGFRLEGTLRDHFCRQGDYTDFHRYGKLAPT